jgi:hypothetical protein
MKVKSSKFFLKHLLFVSAFLIDDHFLFCFEWIGDEIKLEMKLCSQQGEQFPGKLSS